MLLEPAKAEIIVMTIAHLHNFLRKSSTSSTLYMPREIFDSEIPFVVETNETMSSLLPTENAIIIRDLVLQADYA